MALSVLLTLIAYLVPASLPPVILAVPYLFLFPGYALLAALFPSADDLGGIERLTFALAVSITVVPIVVLILHHTPWGIALHSILVSVTCFVVLTCAAGYYRRAKLVPEKRFALRLELDLTGWEAGTVVDKCVTVLLALSILSAVGTLLFVLPRPKIGERFTEFYVLGPSRHADGYRAKVTVGEPVALILGLSNREHEDVRYQVVKDVNGQRTEEIAQIQLAHEEDWEQPLTFSLDQPAVNQQVSFLLYREGQEQPYRSLHLWITVTAPPAGWNRPVTSR